MNSNSPTISSTMADSNALLNFRTQTEYMLRNAILMTEMGMGMKERCTSGEKYVSYLRSLAVRAGRNISALQSTSKSFLFLAQKLAMSVMLCIDNMPSSATDHSCYNLKLEYEKLLAVIEKELSDVEEIEISETVPNLNNLMEKIKYLEDKQRISDTTPLQRSGSVKSVKSDVDEKYPENLSRDSLIDLSNVVNLPPVPEDIFTTFANKPTRTSSLSSLKSMRKVKLFLQRAASHSDDEDLSSDPDEHDFPKMLIGDNDEKPVTNQFTPQKKPFLGNIKEESQD